jgi:flagellar biogenesis protein FliO
MDVVNIGQFLIAFVLVLGLIILLGFAAKRLGIAEKMQRNHSIQKQIELKDTLFIDAKHKLLLVRCRERDYLLAISNEHTQVVDRYDS